MSLKFAAIGNLMALSAFENRVRVEDRFNFATPAETFDPLLALIGRSNQATIVITMKKSAKEPSANHARW